MMAHRSATLEVIPYSLAEALQLTLAVTPNSQGQQTAQREITTALENALDARRQRIIISQSEVNWVKWSCLCLQAVFALVAIAMVHSDNRLASVITLSLFGFGIAAALLLILAHDRPFTGQLSVKPDSLLQVMPGTPSISKGPRPDRLAQRCCIGPTDREALPRQQGRRHRSQQATKFELVINLKTAERWV